MASAVSLSGIGCPAGTNGSLQNEPLSGVCVATAARVTPGSAATSAATSRAPTCRASSATRRTPPASNPVSTCWRFCSVRRNRPAPASSNSASAICPLTRTGSQRDRRRVARTPVPSVDSGPAAVACSAGTTANRTAVASATSVVNARTRGLGATSMSMGRLLVDIRVTRARLAADARPTASVAAASASTSPSISSCRTTRPRLAPSASRSAISCRRAVARASRRLATLAHVISSTTPTTAISTCSGRQ